MKLALPIRPSSDYLRSLIAQDVQIIAAPEDVDHVPDANLFAVWCESPEAAATCRPIAQARDVGLMRYYDGRPWSGGLAVLKAEDMIAPQFYRKVVEPIESFRHYVSMSSQALISLGRIMPIVGIHNRFDGHTKLSPVEVIEAIQVCAEIAERDRWFGAICFRVGTDDLYPQVLPYVQRWFGSAPLPPKPQPSIIHPPVGGSMSVLIGDPIKVPKLTQDGPNKDKSIGELTEVPLSDGKVALRRTNGKMLSLNEFGAYGERDEVLGGDEKFVKADNGYQAFDRGPEDFIVPKCGK